MAMCGMMSGGGGGMLMMAPMSEPLYSAQAVQAEPFQPAYELTLEEEAENIAQILDFLSTLLEEESPENEQAILEMIAVLEEWLEEIDLE